MFCQLFVSSFNATQSYLKVYDCDYDTAKANGYKLLTITHIKKEIERLKREKNKSILVKPDDVLEKMMRIAFSDIKHFMEWGNKDKNNYVSFKDSKYADGDLVHEVKKGKDGVSIKLEDRQKALEWLGKYFLMNPLDKHKIDFDKLKFEQGKQEHADKMTLEIEKIERGIGTEDDTPTTIIFTDNEDDE